MELCGITENPSSRFTSVSPRIPWFLTWTNTQSGSGFVKTTWTIALKPCMRWKRRRQTSYARIFTGWSRPEANVSDMKMPQPSSAESNTRRHGRGCCTCCGKPATAGIWPPLWRNWRRRLTWTADKSSVCWKNSVNVESVRSHYQIRNRRAS